MFETQEIEKGPGSPGTGYKAVLGSGQEAPGKQMRPPQECKVWQPGEWGPCAETMCCAWPWGR